jgi:hypothetical protein
MTDLKLIDYLLYYPYCPVQIIGKKMMPGKYSLIDNPYGSNVIGLFVSDEKGNNITAVDASDLKAILRYPEDLTDAEKNDYELEMAKSLHCELHLSNLTVSARRLHFYLRHRVDTFGLVKAGLAVREKTIPGINQGL